MTKTLIGAAMAAALAGTLLGTPALAQAEGATVAFLMPDQGSTRYEEHDWPGFQAEMEKLCESCTLIYQNAVAAAALQQQQFNAAITQGARVIVLDPVDSAAAASLVQQAQAQDVKVIAYDRPIPDTPADYYVSFDNEGIGRAIAQSLVDHLEAEGVPEGSGVLQINGSPTDNNATLFAQGYMEVLQPHFDDGSFVNAGEPAGTWDPAQARTTFEGQYTANEAINAVVTPNDDNANAVISYLRTLNVPPNTFPTTGQDATLQGLQNVLAGYQCGTVYKSIKLEAQAAAALALFLRAGLEPPAALVNGVTPDTEGGMDVPSVLLTPIWVTPENMAQTVVADGFVSAAELCAGFEEECTAAGIGE